MPSRPALPVPQHLMNQLWWGDALGQSAGAVCASGHPVLDPHLPGGGWPHQAVTEVLQAPELSAEWRLLGPAVAALVAQGGSVLLIGPAYMPHLPGLLAWGIRPDRVVWVDATSMAQRLWATEQALKAGALTAVMSWLPQARPEQIRRLQACAAQHPGLMFAMRPLSQARASSPAPLRLTVTLAAEDADLNVQLIKRRGTPLAQVLRLPVPASLRCLWPWHEQRSAAPLPTPMAPEHQTPQELVHALLDRAVAG